MAVPVETTNECDECDLCCVLSYAEKEFYWETLSGAPKSLKCYRLFWQCKCPGGTRTLQFLSVISPPTWGTVQCWDEYNTSGIDFAGAMPGATYRLKCELSSGEIYYSNQVTLPSTPGDVLPSTCNCFDGVIPKRYGVEIDVMHRNHPTLPDYAQTFGFQFGGSSPVGLAPFAGLIIEDDCGQRVTRLILDNQLNCAASALFDVSAPLIGNCRIPQCGVGVMAETFASGTHPLYYPTPSCSGYHQEFIEARLVLVDCT